MYISYIVTLCSLANYIYIYIYNMHNFDCGSSFCISFEIHENRLCSSASRAEGLMHVPSLSSNYFALFCWLSSYQAPRQLVNKITTKVYFELPE